MPISNNKTENKATEYFETIKEIISNIVSTICEKNDNTESDFNDDLLNTLTES